MNRPTLERYQHDDALRASLERAARRERAEHVHRLLARLAQALFGTRCAARAQSLKPAGCG